MTRERFTFCPWWKHGQWWAVYMDGELLDVYPNLSLAEGYCKYMNGRQS